MRTTRRFAVALATAMVAALAVVLGPPAPAAAEVDVYTTPGEHFVNGRRWQTECVPYSSTQRCTTHIWATTTKWNGNAWVQVTGWNWNNLTYVASPRADWLGNLMATPGEHIVAGRRWSTECDTAWSGQGGCRSKIWATVPERSGSTWKMVNKWVFNNIVNFTAPAPGPGPKPTGPTPPAAATVAITDARHPGHSTSALYTKFAPITVKGQVSGATKGTVVTLQLRDTTGKSWFTTHTTAASDGSFTADLDANFTGWAEIHAALDNSNAGSLVTSIAAPTASVSGTAQIGPFAEHRVTGSVVPAVGGVVVLPQVWANGTWAGIGAVRTEADGTFTINYNHALGRPGPVSLRVQAATASGAQWLSPNAVVLTRLRSPETVITPTTPAEINHTWRVGCPVGASGLATIRINNMGFDGVMERGEIIVRKDLAAEVADVFERSLAAGFPIGQMVNPNHWQGDDKQMMAANNTSAFNCRSVVGNPSAQSPHSRGYAVDVNPWQNPYRDPTGKWWPSTAHVDRTPVVAGQLTTSAEPVKAFKSHGWSWFSGWDWHHFEYRGAARAATSLSTAGADLKPSAATAGSLTAADLEQPTGWDPVVEAGSAEEGWSGNGTFAHEVNPQRKSADLFALGCLPQPDLEAPTAVLEGTLGADGRSGVTLALEFASAEAAATWLATWQEHNRDCGDVTATLDRVDAWEAARTLHDGLWSETAQRDVDVVTITMTNQ